MDTDPDKLLFAFALNPERHEWNAYIRASLLGVSPTLQKMWDSYSESKRETFIVLSMPDYAFDVMRERVIKERIRMRTIQLHELTITTSPQ